MKKSISNKLIRLNVFLVVFALFLMSFMSMFFIKGYLEKQLIKDLISESKLFQKMAQDGAMDQKKINRELLRSNLDDNYKFYRREFESQSIIFSNKNGYYQPIFYSSRRNLLDNESIQTIINNVESGKYNFKFTSNGVEYLAVARNAKNISNNKASRGFVLTYISNNTATTIIKGISKILFLSMLLSTCICIAVIFFASKKITNPIVKLTNLAKEISNRNFDSTISINTGDEIESLSNSINKMACSIKDYDTNQKHLFQNISHELKTPLMSIQGYAEGVRDNMFDDNKKALNIIIDESNRVKKYVEDIIFLSKLEMMDISFEYSFYNINDVIISSIEKVESIAILGDIDIMYSPKEDVYLNIDKDKLIQALINLLSNCLKYTKDTIGVDTLKTNDYFEIKIWDNGNGFNKDDLNKIFNRFYKGEKEGSGIGMSIVQEVIKNHNGTISANNRNIGGAEFTIKIPLS
ncbi:HAMP domain-containing sensor histidine kinase [Tepidibacter aestuarii]|uniref:HAMP domain-containing sensor histidine kinase n=1 Tax=Tepidibacter aestuarii TaxID=2925782 RepID=UPI0020BEA6D3|nr:HAMP domain-containing sensor histidine kinase [Tepidibacter aestuarii]CAH2214892.1 two-component system, OmpR family, sensor histidine kinase CssS [Tepidibacter aestuarii]